MSAEWIERMSEARVVDVAGELGGFDVREAGASWSIGPCPLCDAETRTTRNHKDRRGPIGSPKNKPQSWRCHVCTEKGDALHFVAIVRERGQRYNELDDSAKSRVREWCEQFLGLVGDRPAYQPPAPSKLEYPPPGEVRDLWALCEPVTKLLDVAAALALRRIDPEHVAHTDVARALPADVELPRWAGYGDRSWARTGHRLIFPLYDHRGVMRSVLARLAIPTEPGEKKSLAPQRPHDKHPGFGRSGLVVASASARESLADSTCKIEKLLITEGEIDLLTWTSEPDLTPPLQPLVAVAIYSGSWSEAFARRLAPGAEVTIAVDNDPPRADGKETGGDAFARIIVESLKGRARHARWRQEGVKDANEARMAGIALVLPDMPVRVTRDGVPEHLLDEPMPEEEEIAIDAWQDALTRNSRGKIDGSLGNCITILEHDEPWKDCIAYNERSDRIVWLRCPPIAELERQGPYPRPLRDSDEVWICKGLERRWCAFSLRDVHAALMAIARLKGFDPVKDYLDSLTWDGEPRIDTWLERLAGAPATSYARAVASKWLISAVARVYEPGCQVDHVLVLEGAQGAGKSSLVSALCARAEWFSDQLGDIRQRVAAAELLQGPWLIEIPELDATQKAEASTIKAFLSSKVDKYRAAYARNNADHPRRCVFVATTNETSYLKDASGGRRFWAVAIGQVVDVARARLERDQLWAEARARYQGGEAWHFDRAELVEAAREEQAGRYTEDPWEHVIRAHLAKMILVLASDRTPRVTVEECLAKIGIAIQDWSDKDAKRVVAILTQRLGWARKQRRDGVGGARRWAYEPMSPRHPLDPGDGGGDGQGGDGDGGREGSVPATEPGDMGSDSDRGSDAGTGHDSGALHSLSPPSLLERETQELIDLDHVGNDHARARAHAGNRYASQPTLSGSASADFAHRDPLELEDWAPEDYADPF